MADLFPNTKLSFSVSRKTLLNIFPSFNAEVLRVLTGDDSHTENDSAITLKPAHLKYIEGQL
jgi:hypothetical protein